MGTQISPQGTFTDPWKTIADNGTLRVGWGTVTNDTLVLYTVPANKVFWIVGVSIYWYTTATNAGLTARMGIAEGWILDIEAVETNDAHDGQTMSFPIPLKIAAAQTVTVQSGGADLYVNGTVIGYEVDA